MPVISAQPNPLCMLLHMVQDVDSHGGNCFATFCTLAGAYVLVL